MTQFKRRSGNRNLDSRSAAGRWCHGRTLHDETTSPRASTLERFRWKRGDIHPKRERELKAAFSAACFSLNKVFASRSHQLSCAGVTLEHLGQAGGTSCRLPHTIGRTCCQEKLRNQQLCSKTRNPELDDNFPSKRFAFLTYTNKRLHRKISFKGVSGLPAHSPHLTLC